MSDKIVNVTDASFDEEVIKAEGPVLVDFWAEWCGPCKMIAPLLDAVADEYDGKLKVVKVDIDSNQGVPGQYGVRGIPTLLLFKNRIIHTPIVKCHLVDIDNNLKLHTFSYYGVPYITIFINSCFFVFINTVIYKTKRSYVLFN